MAEIVRLEPRLSLLLRRSSGRSMDMVSHQQTTEIDREYVTTEQLVNAYQVAYDTSMQPHDLEYDDDILYAAERRAVRAGVEAVRARLQSNRNQDESIPDVLSRALVDWLKELIDAGTWNPTTGELDAIIQHLTDKVSVFVWERER